jgi:hypothetical protein
MSSPNRRPDDDSLDDAALDIRKPYERNHTLLIVLVVVGTLLVLSTCVAGIPLFEAITAMFDDPHPAKLHGSWKGRFVVQGKAIDVIYTFKKDGNFRQEEIDARGKVIGVVDGHWQVVDGEIEIDWNDGSFENAVVDWVDNNTMNYTIVEHSDQVQVGVIANLRRK